MRIPATCTATFTIEAPIGSVYSFFSDPDKLNTVTAAVLSYRRIDEETGEWRLAEKNAHGIRFQACYTTRYRGNGHDTVEWTTLAGNLDCSGQARFMAAGRRGTEVHYREVIAPDIPVTRTMAFLIRRIVERESREETHAFLNRVKASLEGRLGSDKRELTSDS